MLLPPPQQLIVTGDLCGLCPCGLRVRQPQTLSVSTKPFLLSFSEGRRRVSPRTGTLPPASVKSLVASCKNYGFREAVGLSVVGLSTAAQLHRPTRRGHSDDSSFAAWLAGPAHCIHAK